MSIAFSAIFLFLFCILGLIAILGTIFWIWMIVDCATNEPADSTDKVLWVLVIVLTHLIGAAIYFFVRRPARKKIVGH